MGSLSDLKALESVNALSGGREEKYSRPDQISPRRGLVTQDYGATDSRGWGRDDYHRQNVARAYGSQQQTQELLHQTTAQLAESKATGLDLLLVNKLLNRDKSNTCVRV